MEAYPTYDDYVSMSVCMGCYDQSGPKRSSYDPSERPDVVVLERPGEQDDIPDESCELRSPSPPASPAYYPSYEDPCGEDASVPKDFCPYGIDGCCDCENYGTSRIPSSPSYVRELDSEDRDSPDRPIKRRKIGE